MCLACGRMEGDHRTTCGHCYSPCRGRIGDWWCQRCEGVKQPEKTDACPGCGEPNPKKSWVLGEMARLRETQEGADAWTHYSEHYLDGNRDPEDQPAIA